MIQQQLLQPECFKITKQQLLFVQLQQFLHYLELKLVSHVESLLVKY